MESNSWHKMSSIVYEARKLEVDGKPVRQYIGQARTYACMHAQINRPKT